MKKKDEKPIQKPEKPIQKPDKAIEKEHLHLICGELMMFGASYKLVEKTLKKCEPKKAKP